MVLSCGMFVKSASTSNEDILLVVSQDQISIAKLNVSFMVNSSVVSGAITPSKEGQQNGYSLNQGQEALYLQKELP